MTKRTLIWLAVSALASAMPPTASAADSCGGVTLPAQASAFGAPLVRNGVGIREVTFLNVDVYVAGLYVSRKTGSVTEILKPDAPKLMMLRFVRNVSRDEMVDALQEALRNNLGAEYPKVQERMQRFVTRLPQLHDGTVLSLAYRPGHGIELSVDGKSLGIDKDDHFGNLIFRAWLGPKPPDRDLKAGLLGGPCE